MKTDKCEECFIESEGRIFAYYDDVDMSLCDICRERYDDREAQLFTEQH